MLIFAVRSKYKVQTKHLQIWQKYSATLHPPGPASLCKSSNETSKAEGLSFQIKMIFCSTAFILQVNQWGKNALHKACQDGHKKIVEHLLKHPDIDVNAQDNLGQTALHLAVSDDDIDVCMFLIK